MQRGHNRQAVVADAADCEQLLAMAMDAAANARVQVHGFAVLVDEVHWLLTPPDDAAVSLFMQALGRRYGRYFNARHGRSGSLWDGRFRSTVFEAEPHMLAHLVYVDTLAVRQGLAARAEDFRWSSAMHHIGDTSAQWLATPPQYWALGNTPFERELRYRDLLNEGLSAIAVQQIEQAVQSGWAMGSPVFTAELQQALGRRVQPGRRGRPRREAGD